MKEILPNIYAVAVPKDAYYLKSNETTLIYISDEEGVCEIQFKEHKYKFLGTVTPNEIDFDVPIFGDFVLPSFSNYEAQKAGFRSALTAAGITQYDKLVILRKI